MGQKVNPVGIRLGIIRRHKSVWYADKRRYLQNLHADIRLRAKLTEILKNASVSLIQIDMLAKTAVITIHTARPGLVIGKKGDDLAKLRVIAEKELGRATHINIREISKPDIDAKLVAQSIANQLERRVMFRRAMKRAIQNAMRSGAEGIKIKLSGRLGGAEIARSELQKEGRIPLHTFRADIDYAAYTALTTYGIIGVSVWIFKGEVLDGMASVETELQRR